MEGLSSTGLPRLVIKLFNYCIVPQVINNQNTESQNCIKQEMYLITSLDVAHKQKFCQLIIHLIKKAIFMALNQEGLATYYI